LSHPDDPLSTNHLGSATYEKAIDFLSNPLESATLLFSRLTPEF
jgi:hypothetical protein